MIFKKLENWSQSNNNKKDILPIGNLGILFLRTFNIKTSLYKHKLFSISIWTFVLLMT